MPGRLSGLGDGHLPAAAVATTPAAHRRARLVIESGGPTNATKLIAQPASLTDQEVAGMMAWSPQQVADIRRVYVDQARAVVAIGERIRGSL